MTEEQWYQRWQAGALSARAPAEMALSAGHQADALVWLFVGGYQAAIRQVFPVVPTTGWAAFAATEDPNHPKTPHAGTVLAADGEDWRLNGFKTWVAQSRHVEHLVVSAKIPDRSAKGFSRHGVLVHRDTPGVSLTHRDDARFLADMSQGYAEFENVHIAKTHRVSSASMGLFGATEAAFVKLTCAAFLSRSLTAPLVTCAGSVTQELYDACAAVRNNAKAPEVSKSCNESYSALVTALQDQPLMTKHVVDWTTNHRLLSMYNRLSGETGNRR